MPSSKFIKPPSEKDIEKVIAQGASEPKSSKSKKKTDSQKKDKITLTIVAPRGFINDLDEHLNGKRLRPSRAQWILEAMDEKMTREQKA